MDSHTGGTGGSTMESEYAERGLPGGLWDIDKDLLVLSSMVRVSTV